jgi:stress response protein YsnF
MSKTPSSSAERLQETKTVIPLAEEELTIDKDVRLDARVQVNKTVNTREVPVDTELWQTHYEIERIEHDRPLDEAPQPRYEGETLILPVLEERLVKKLFLKEEVRLTPKRRRNRLNETVTLRSEDVEIDRTAVNPKRSMNE